MKKTPIDLVTDIQKATNDALVSHVDAHVETNHDAVVQATADMPAAPGTPAFCTVYTAARPVLVFVRGMLFFRPKWQTVVTALIGGLDTVCPQQ